MIISEKQIANLIAIAHDFIYELKEIRLTKGLTKTGQERLNSICSILTEIIDQQSEELKDIK